MSILIKGEVRCAEWRSPHLQRVCSGPYGMNSRMAALLRRGLAGTGPGPSERLSLSEVLITLMYCRLLSGMGAAHMWNRLQSLCLFVVHAQILCW